MTNYPPPQGQPYGMPPQGGLPYGQPGTQMAPKSNGMSVAALVTGLLSFCIPALGGLLAIIFGVLGIKKSKQTNSGKGMSIAGLILGVLSLAVWGLFGGAIVALFSATAVNRDLAKQFINDLAAGNTTAAATAVDSSSIPPEEIQKFSDMVKANGAITDITAVGASTSSSTGSPAQAEVGAVVTFSNGKRQTIQTSQRKLNEQWKIVGVQITNQ